MAISDKFAPDGYLAQGLGPACGMIAASGRSPDRVKVMNPDAPPGD
jgi:hypothetical protein